MRAVRRTMPGMIWSAIAATACATSSPPAVTVDLQPAAAQVLPGGMVEFVATARGAASVGVSWAVVEAQGGVVDSTGHYQAPLAKGSYHVTATSQAAPSASAAAVVTVTDGPAVGVAISPHSASLSASGTLTFAATVTGAADRAVTWSVLEGVSGGSVTSGGVYTAPLGVGTYHVIATAHADAAATDTAVVTVLAPGVQVSPPSALVVVALTTKFSAQVVGGTGGVTWSLGEGAAGGSISASGLYTAPAAPGTYHVVATSQSDASKTRTATVTVARTGQWINVTPAGITLDPAATAGSGPNFPANYGAQEVVADSANPGSFYTSFTYQGIWKSVDFGATWTRLTDGSSDLDKGRPALEIAPDGSYLISTNLYPVNGASNGAWKSVPPLGASWRRIDVPGVPNGDDLRSFDIDRGDKNHVFAHPHSDNGSFHESVDAGETWRAQPLPTGIGVTQRLHVIDGGTLLAVFDWGSGVSPRLGRRSGTTWPWTWSWSEVFSKNESGV